MTTRHSDSAPPALRRRADADGDMAALASLGGGTEVPVAVFLRTSTRDLQDPTLSLPRQLENCRKVLPPGFTIVAFFYDVESSRKDLDQRGLGSAHEAFNIPIPRDGGLADLLAEAQHPGRRFEAVVVEEIERAARWTYQSTQLEHTLERAGVPLFAADEGPISITEKRATQILVRRMKQGVGEWFLRHTLEQSWDGFREHTRQGWNIGKPCYGYLAERLPHPVAAKREEGKTKSRLIVDPERGPTVTRIYNWRHDKKLAYKVIAERLNLDLDRYPPPQPNRRERARNHWTVSAVREILCNPKYTGYMVWNRRATKKGGKVNTPDKWIWSPEPTHEPLVTLDQWKAVQEIAKARQGSRMAGPNPHPATRRTYVLRHYVHHTQCDKRMFGKTRRDNAYYTCQPQLDRVGNPQDYADHPRSVYVREDRLLDAVQTFFTQRVLGPDRTVHLRHQLAKQGTSRRDDHQQRIAAIEKTIADLARRQDNLMDERETRTLDDGDEIGRAWAERLRARFADLENQRRAKQAELDELRTTAEREQPQHPELLDLLPAVALVLPDAPDPLQRALYEACGIKIYYDHNTRHVTIHATLRADTLPAIEQAATAIAMTSPNSKPPTRTQTTTTSGDDVAHVLRVLPGALTFRRVNQALASGNAAGA
ncbi:recombinase family protein [Saccharothrix deserti]|uniref:recombinase family protein n=1 Tax=Saccharothrix deserti TaxID=2593674 RepID=UPI00131C61F9|nr:recombinase family protein [Saccharothrix deserti]